MAIAYTGLSQDLDSPAASLLTATNSNRGEPGVVINDDGTFSNIGTDRMAVSYSEVQNGDLVDQVFWINNTGQTMVVKAISAIHGTIGSDGSAVSLDVERLQGTEAEGGNGDTLLTTVHDLKSTVDTVVDLTLTATAANLEIADGDRLAIDYQGTLTAVTNVCVTVILVPGALETPAES